ncbi:MAG: polysaccharide biosynthesis C-terminal domain-containing protein, partial [Armatimonadetes bacterium]|nr:polysaccharide biosynthesis C-terminal domain-containing protein [Armatimonadota bacterium]
PEVVVASCTLSVAFLIYRVAYGVLVGLQAFSMRNLISVLASAVLLAGILVVILLRLHPTALQLVLIQLFATIVAVAVAMQFVLWKHPAGRAPLPPDWRKTYLAYGAKGATTVFVQHMNYRLDTMIVNAIMGGAAVGVYSAGVSAAQVLLLIPAAVSVVQMPRVASSGQARGVESAPLALGATLYLVAGAAVVLGIGMPFIVMVLYGKAYQGAIAPGLWLLPGMWSVAVLNVMGSTFSGLGRPGCNTVAVACGLVATAALDFTLIPRYGILGAAWASTAAYSLAAIVSIAIFTRVGRMPFRKLLTGTLAEPPKWALARLTVLRSTIPHGNDRERL